MPKLLMIIRTFIMTEMSPQMKRTFFHIFDNDLYINYIKTPWRHLKDSVHFVMKFQLIPFLLFVFFVKFLYNRPDI